MPGRLQGKIIAVLATDGFEQSELLVPVEALRDEGAVVEIVAPKAGEIQGWDHLTPDRKVAVDKTLDQARSGDYDALVLPGGVANPDQLRMDDRALQFIRTMLDDGKPAGVICHAPWLLIDTGHAEGRTLTSWPSIRADLRNAGANVVDQEVVVDRGIVTSRKPDDLPAFCEKIIEEFAEGGHAGGRAAGAETGQQPSMH